MRRALVLVCLIAFFAVVVMLAVLVSLVGYFAWLVSAWVPLALMVGAGICLCVFAVCGFRIIWAFWDRGEVVTPWYTA